jgi:formylglycine-generating enzyme required for sulfatase activity
MRKVLTVGVFLSVALLFAIWQQFLFVTEIGGVAALEAQPPVDAKPAIAGFTFVETNAQGYPEYIHDSSGIRFVRLPGGPFEMGSPAGETGHQTNESPVHTVSVSPFLIAKHEVTQAQYEAVMKGHESLEPTPSFHKGPNLPVEQVAWTEIYLADGFLARTGLSLPREAQWEYACRAGTLGPYAGTGKLDDMGWYASNSGSQTHAVGSKQPNQFGLYDMHGNVWEWCADKYEPGTDKVVRGGSFDYYALHCRSAYRSAGLPAIPSDVIGVRPAKTLP